MYAITSLYQNLLDDLGIVSQPLTSDLDVETARISGLSKASIRSLSMRQLVDRLMQFALTSFLFLTILVGLIAVGRFISFTILLLMR